MKHLGIAAAFAFCILGCDNAKPPPGRSESITLNAQKGAKLEGTLLIPDKTPAPFVVMLPDGSELDRDGNVRPNFMNDLPKQIAEDLQRQGIGSFRFDGRLHPKTFSRSGASSADYSKWLSWKTLRSDAIDAVKFVRSRPESDDKRIGIIAHGEGTLLALDTTQDTDPAALILLSPWGLPFEDILRHALVQNYLQDDPPASMRKIYLDELDRVIKSVKKSGSANLVPRALSGVFNDERNSLTQEMMRLDPPVIAGSVNAPILLLGGAEDQQIDAEENAAQLMAALRNRSNSVQESTITPGLGHFLKPVSENADGDPEEETTAPLPSKISETISTWLKKHI